MQLAEDMGMTVEVRQIPEDEIGTFDEAGACGTAAVISPIARIDDLDENKSYIFSLWRPDRVRRNIPVHGLFRRPLNWLRNFLLLCSVLFRVERRGRIDGVSP